MKRFAAVALAAGALGLSGALAAPAAFADGPSLCVNYDVNLNGQGGADQICLPPAGTPAPPTLPGLPGLPL